MSKVSLQEFADRLNELMPTIAREFLRRQTIEFFKGKITVPQLCVLDFLYRYGPSKMTDLAHSMDVTTAAMTGVVERLVRDAYAVRVFDSTDRRIIKITLSPAGTALVRSIIAQKRQMIIRVFGKISQHERETYLKILTHVHQVLGKIPEA